MSLPATTTPTASTRTAERLSSAGNVLTVGKYIDGLLTETAGALVFRLEETCQTSANVVSIPEFSSGSGESHIINYDSPNVHAARIFSSADTDLFNRLVILSKTPDAKDFDQLSVINTDSEGGFAFLRRAQDGSVSGIIYNVNSNRTRAIKLQKVQLQGQKPLIMQTVYEGSLTGSLSSTYKNVSLRVDRISIAIAPPSELKPLGLTLDVAPDKIHQIAGSVPESADIARLLPMGDSLMTWGVREPSADHLFQTFNIKPTKVTADTARRLTLANSHLKFTQIAPEYKLGDYIVLGLPTGQLPAVGIPRNPFLGMGTLSGAAERALFTLGQPLNIDLDHMNQSYVANIMPAAG